MKTVFLRLSAILLLMLISSVATAIPWCHQGPHIDTPVVSWSGAVLQNYITENRISGSPTATGLAMIASNHYCNNADLGHTSASHGIPERGIGAWHTGPESFYTFNAIYSIDQGLSFFCKICDPDGVFGGDIQIDKVVDRVGDTLTYTVIVFSDGSRDANNVIVTDVLPPGLIYVSHKLDGDAATFNPATGILTIPVLRFVQLEIKLTIGENACGTIENVAKIISPFDSNPNNNEASVAIVLPPCPEECVPPPANMVAWWPFDEESGPVATDLARGHDGTHTNGPVPVVGFMGGALSFDGSDDFVEVADSAALDFGTGDLSIDAWVKTQQVSGVYIIVDKRVEKSSPAGVQGYSLFLTNGLLGFQLADGIGSEVCSSDPTESSCTNYGSSAFVGDGAWHHIAVTVQRGASDGGRFYVDGELVGKFDPTIRKGSLTNSSPLTIGRRSDNPSGGYFHGEIDNIELFNRALTPAEILRLFEAQDTGKCTDGLFPQWDVHFCPTDAVTKTATTMLCNYSGTPASYDLEFSSVAAGTQLGSPNGHVLPCPSTGPTVFINQDPSNPVDVNPKSCVAVNVSMGMFDPNPSIVSCYQVDATNLDTGNTVTAAAQAWVSSDWCAKPDPVVVGGDANTNLGPRIIEQGASQEVTFNVSNATGVSRLFDYEIEIMPSDQNLAKPIISLNGLEVGTNLRGRIAFEPGESKSISMIATVVEHVPFVMNDLLLWVDLDGDGVKEPFSSVVIQSIPAQVECDPNTPGAIIGTPGNDRLIGTPGDDVIIGLDGDDEIIGGGGNDCIVGGSGNDRIIGGKGNDSIAGGPGDDTIIGGGGDDKIVGGSGNDTIIGGQGDDSIDGGLGIDKALGGPGIDSCQNAENAIGCE